MWLEGLVLLGFVTGSGAVLVVYFAFGRKRGGDLRGAIDRRLRDLRGREPLIPDGGGVIRRADEDAAGVVDRAARRAIKGTAFDAWLAQSGLRVGPGTLVFLALLAGGAGALAALAATHLAWAAGLAFAAGASAPFLVVKSRRTARLRRFEEQFPEGLDLISRAVRAGHAFSAALKMVADEVRDPVGPEFRKVFDEQNYGLPIKDSLHNLAVRVPLLDVRFFATAVLIQRDTGGNLAEVLDNLAHVVRERFKIRRQVRVHTAHGRFTGYVLLALPAFLAVALSYINPEHMNLLFQDPIGQTLIVVAIGMQAVGWFWIRQVVKIEV